MSVAKITAEDQKQKSTTAVRGFRNGSGIQPITAKLVNSGIQSIGTNDFAGDSNIKMKEKFRKIFPEISKEVDPKGHILRLLFEKEVITIKEKSAIHALKDQRSRCVELLNLLANSKHPNALLFFKEALRKDHQLLVDAIDSEVNDPMPQDEESPINEKDVYDTLVPMKTIDIMVRIQGFVANVDCTLWYYNTSETPMEVVYEFPMDEQSAVYRFEAMIDGRTIVAECQEKKEAKVNYTRAIESGLTATLMEEDDSSSDIFRCSLGHLPSNAEAEVRFAYVTELSLEPEGHLSFVLPTVLNPRYNPSIPDGGRMNPPDISYLPKALPQPYTIIFNVVIADAERVTCVTSHKDELNVFFDDNRNEVKVSLAKPFNADHDLSFDVTYRDTCQPKVIIEKGRPSEDGFLSKDIVMLNFFPDFNLSNFSNTKHEFIFLIDRSGSMAGRRIRKAKESLRLFLDSLPLDCYFNIIGYGSNFQVLFFDGSRQSCELSLNQAREYVENIVADLGGTEILAPLRFVFNKPGITSHNRQVILLTDGDVTNSQAVIELISNHAYNTRVFSIGIGEGASTSLVKGVARAGRGKAAFVKDREHMQPVIMNMLESAKRPGVTDIRVQWKSDRLEDLTPVLVPHRIPPLYSGDRLILYAVFPGLTDMKATVTLSGNIGTEVIEYSLTVDFSEAVPSFDSSFPLHRLAAKAEIKQLQTGEKAIPTTRNLEVKSSIVSLSIDANIVSRHTSMVAIDRQLNAAVKEVNMFQCRDAVKCKVPLMPDQQARVSPPSKEYFPVEIGSLESLNTGPVYGSLVSSACRYSMPSKPDAPQMQPVGSTRQTTMIAIDRQRIEPQSGETSKMSTLEVNAEDSDEDSYGYMEAMTAASLADEECEKMATTFSQFFSDKVERIKESIRSALSRVPLIGPPRKLKKISEALGINEINNWILNIPLIENLQLTKEQSKEVVSGICAIGDTIYVVCRASSEVFGYQVGSGGSDPEVIEVDGMQLPSDMTSCESNQALFISDTNPDDRCIWKIQLPGKDISRWSAEGIPRGLSMTFSNELMVIIVQTEVGGRLEFYSPSSSECLKKMSLPKEYEDVWHAVQTTKGTYVIAYSCSYATSESVYWLTEISSDGTWVCCVEVRRRLALYHLSIDKNDNVFVADKMGVLRVDLASERGIVKVFKKHPRLVHGKFSEPIRLFHQSNKQGMIVGWYNKLSGHSGVSVFGSE